MYASKSGTVLKLERTGQEGPADVTAQQLYLKPKRRIPGPRAGDEVYRRPLSEELEGLEGGFHPWPVVKMQRGGLKPTAMREPPRFKVALPPLAQGYLELAPELQTQLEARHHRQTKSSYAAPKWILQFDILWLLAILVYGVGDIVTSNVAFSVGASELNPVLYPMINNSVWSFVRFKAIVLVSLMLISTWLITIKSDARMVPLFTLAVGLFLVANNLIVVGRLLGWL